MLSSLMRLALLAVYLTSVTQASPLPQNPPNTNAPAGPPMTTAADLGASLGDLVIPQKEAANVSAPTTNGERSAPMDLNRLVEDLGDFRLPSNVTVGHVVQAAK